MLSDDLSNTDVIVKFPNGSIVIFSNIKDVSSYMIEHNISLVEVLQVNYWGTFFINSHVPLDVIKNL